MDEFDKFSGNNNPEQNNENAESFNFSDNTTEKIGTTNEKSAEYSDGNFYNDYVPSEDLKDSCSSEKRDNSWQNREPVNNGVYNDNYRSQTPPPYNYGEGGYNNQQNYNSFSAQQQYNNSNPYPYANRSNGANNQNSFNGGANNNSGKKTVKIIVAVVAALIVILLGTVIGIVVNSGNSSTDNSTSSKSETSTVADVEEAETQSTPTNQSSATSDGLTPKDIYEKISEASVGVIVYENSSEESGEGSGVLLKEDKDGKYTYIITCAHVISGAKKAVVQLADNTEYAADIIGADSRTDIGVLRIEAHGLTLAEIGDSEKISVGDSVYAIGNPGGTSFAGSFTDGMISALDRPVNSETGYTMKCIQHTAAINPGNSGGALVNSYGQLIGINSSKIVSEDYEGMGFSVPSSVFVEIFNSIVANGYVTDRAKLGITYVAASEYNSYYGMYVAIKGLPSGSLVVYSISSDSDLANTEVQKGDLIVSVNGKKLDDSATLAEAVENGSVGDTLTLGIVRINENYSSEEFEVKVKLVEDKDGTSSTVEESTTQEYSMEDYFRQYFGDSYSNDSGNDYYGYGGSNSGNYGW